MDALLGYDEALARILAETAPLGRPVERSGLSGLNGLRVLAEPLFAKDAHPRFNNAAVDGYAFHLDDLEKLGTQLRVAFTAASGATELGDVAPGSVARIYTGAVIPAGTAAVAMQEDVTRDGDFVTISSPVGRNANIRRAGTDFREGEPLLEPGTPLRAGIIGVLASQGVTEPAVFPRPKCTFVSTGDEIVPPEASPGPGQLRNSIGPMLSLASAPYADAANAYSPDDPGRLEAVLELAAAASDAIFVAGGASVGDRDFTAKVVAQLGTVSFHGVRLRPGKPLLFGQVRGKPVIGLPGNPASAFVCFHLFGVPLLRRLGGWKCPGHTWIPVPYAERHSAEQRDVFARVSIVDGAATPILEQSSFGIRALGAADALARLPAGRSLNPGDLVQLAWL